MAVNIDLRGEPLFSNSGEVEEALRSTDWANTVLGPPETWPATMRATLGVCFGSRFPIITYWGQELAVVYNSAYIPIFGAKHPYAMGMTARQAWGEIWDVIGPMLEDEVLGRGRATWSDDQLLLLRRHGFTEECYFTWSFSPIRGDDGSVIGVFTAVFETTTRVINDRRLSTLRELGGESLTEAEAAATAARALAQNPLDVPFAALYLTDGEGDLSLAAHTGLKRTAATRVAAVPDALDKPRPWHVTDLDALLDDTPAGPWPDPPSEAIVMPIARSGSAEIAGALVLGISPRLRFDDAYRDFFGLIAARIESELANARAYQEERRRAEALAELDRAKTMFFTNISHELRTPLTLLLGPLEGALRDASLEDRDRERLEVAHRNAERLLRLVNNLLDFSRIEAGRVEAAYEATDIAAFTGELASMFRSAFERAGIELIVDAPPLSQPVYIDREMWEKIVMNLLSNAFKFTLEGSVRVSVREDDGHACVTVADTGVGVPRDALPRLFDRFYRVENTRGRTFEGTGIGLALVQELVRLHAGEIEADSTEGAGTTFTVRIPYGTSHLAAHRVNGERRLASTATGAEAYVEEALRWLPASGQPDEAAQVRIASTQAVRTAGGRVLVADDNADMREYLARLLGGHWRVEQAANGRDALERARANRPDLVLADVMMPGIDGFALLRALRDDAATRGVPVVLLSARAGEEARVEGLAAGADDYITKPFSAAELVARIDARIEIARAQHAANAHWRVLAEHNPWFTSLYGADGRALYFNPALRAYLGLLDEVPLPERSLLDIVHPDDLPEFGRQRQAAIAAGVSWSGEVRVRRHDGAYRWFEFTDSPVHDDRRRAVARIRVSVDVTDRRTMERELRDALEAKEEFLSMVSHELRTPLTTILGNATLLAGERAAALPQTEREGALMDVAQEAQRLARIIDDMLALARLDRGHPTELEPVRMPPLLHAAARRHRLTYGARDLRVECSPELPLANANPDYIEQILNNLLTNAEKYGARDGAIEVNAARRDHHVVVSVKDRGEGVTPQQIDRLFDPFFRGGARRSAPGIGLGLTVCKRLVEAQGGRISAARRDGGGSVFSFTLPLLMELDEG